MNSSSEHSWLGFRLTRLDLWIIAGIALFVGLASAWELVPFVRSALSDYSIHIRMWALVREGGRLSIPHVGFMTSAWGLGTFFGDNPLMGGFAVGIISHILAALIIYAFIRTVRPASSAQSVAVTAALTLMLAFISPIVFFSLHADMLYLGYIAPSIYHNPTFTLAKPMLLGVFTMVLLSLVPNRRVPNIGVALTALLSILLVFTKPNYTLCLLPAAALIAGARLLRRQPVDWRLLLLGFGIPSVLSLAAQFAYTYFFAADHAGIMLSPFTVVAEWTSNRWKLIAAAFIGSLTYPAAVYLLFHRAARKDTALNLAWLTLIPGIFMYYLLVETGGRMYHGNFTWGAAMSNFVLFVVTTQFMLRQFQSTRQWTRPLAVRRFIILLIFAMHVISGVIVFLANPLTPTS